MSLATGESKKNVSNGSELQLRLGALLTMVVVGCATYFWLTSSHDVHTLHRLPTSKVHFLLAMRVLIAAFVVYALLIPRIKQWIYRVGHGGDYNRALQLDRLWSVLPLYGSSLKGPILFNAGRYREAIEFLKPLAFDRQGKPRLTSIELYTYAIALENSGREAAAQVLLEAANSVPQNGNTIRVALATCLLTQNKEPERACKLLEQALAGSENLSRADQARRIARYAYALASCGRRPDAEAKIQEALAMGATLTKDDLAGVYYFVGEAWRALGDITNARNAFQQAVTLCPDGVTALSVQKALAKMDGKWNTWQSQN
jgi:tetratricopeptide (TPR) repeat protein